jgi:hypothetical protein
LSNKQELPLTYDKWRSTQAYDLDPKYQEAFSRLHGEDVNKKLEEMLEAEYKEYLSNFNGKWLINA